MKFFMLLLCLICCKLTGFTQDISYDEEDRKALAISSSQTHTTADIAAYIKSNFDTDSKKVRAIYTWVAANIRYNTDSIHPIIFEEDRDLRNASTLRRKAGVCENYASIFNDICLKSGLRSLIVEGYTKQNGYMDRTAHAWCTVYVDNKWQLYDPTWDEDMAHRGVFTGNINYEYFQMPPEIFIQTHMPFDPMYQLLDHPITYQEFYSGNTSANHNKPYFNYTDSISAYEKQDQITKYLATATRIEENGAPTQKVNNKVNQLKMDIEIIRQDRDTLLYNSAVADYNEALAKFNTFITYRNNQFTPLKSDEEVQAIFNEVEKKIATARSRVNEINNSKANLTLNTAPLEKVLNDLSLHLKEQHDFLKSYLSSAKEK